MNIFVTSDSPEESARYLDDIRLIHGCLDSARILSTALWRNHVWDTSCYRPVAEESQNPCVIWTAKSRNNFLWLVKFGLEACREYKFRHDRPTIHGANVIIKNCLEVLQKSQAAFIETNITPFANNTPYKTEFDTVTAYHKFLNENEWIFDPVPPKWTKRDAPWFYRENLRKVI